MKHCGGEQRRQEELSSLLNFSVNINCSKNKVYELKKNSSGWFIKEDTVTWKIHHMEHPFCNGVIQIRQVYLLNPLELIKKPLLDYLHQTWNYHGKHKRSSLQYDFFKNGNSGRRHSLPVRSLLLSLVAISGPVTIDQIGTTKRTATSNTLEIYYQIKTYAQRQLSSGDQQSSVQNVRKSTLQKYNLETSFSLN